MMDGGSYLGNNGGRTVLVTLRRLTFGQDGKMKRFLTEYEKLVKSGGFLSSR